MQGNGSDVYVLQLPAESTSICLSVRPSFCLSPVSPPSPAPRPQSLLCVSEQLSFSILLFFQNKFLPSKQVKQATRVNFEIPSTAPTLPAPLLPPSKKAHIALLSFTRLHNCVTLLPLLNLTRPSSTTALPQYKREAKQRPRREHLSLARFALALAVPLPCVHTCVQALINRGLKLATRCLTQELNQRLLSRLVPARRRYAA